MAEITRGDPYCILRSYIKGDEYDLERQKTIRDICAKVKNYGYLLDSSLEGDIEEACKKINAIKK